MKILLLEDEIMLQSSIIEYLETLGHQCFGFSSGAKVQAALTTSKYDLMIFDINVPHLNGLELFENIQQNNCSTPVIFISALTDIDSIANAFTLGAVDYIKKPFHLKELALRVQKISKDIENINRTHIILSQNYSYTKQSNTLLFNGKPQQLTNKQTKIIQLLCQNIGNIISLDTFREYIWEHNYVSDATIRTEISRLRKKLYEDFIQNHKGIGYKIDRYIASV